MTDKTKPTTSTTYNATIFTQTDLFDSNGQKRLNMNDLNDSLFHILQYFRCWALQHANSLQYLILAVHNKDVYPKDSKETDENGALKYRKGDFKGLHVHVAMKFLKNYGKSWNAVAKNIYDEFNISDNDTQIKHHQRHVEMTQSEGNYLFYLTHSNQPTKTPYGLNNLMIFKFNHVKNKKKIRIDEDFQDIKQHAQTREFWGISIKKGQSLILNALDENHHETNDSIDTFDTIARRSNKLKMAWNGTSQEFMAGQCLIRRQSNHATKWFIGYRDKFAKEIATNSAFKASVYGGKPGGSKYYHQSLPIKGNKYQKVSEVDQIVYDLQHGNIKYYEVNDTLTDDFGAIGARVFDENKDGIFIKAVSDWVDKQVRDIDDLNNSAKRQLSTIYTSAFGGSGKEYITKIERQLLTGTAETQKMTASGKKKTPDLFKGWDNLLNSTGSDIDGNMFNCHEFTQVFDVDTAPKNASGRNSNTPYLPNWVWFTNSDSLREFITSSMISTDRESYCSQSVNDKGNTVYHYGHLNHFIKTENMKKQMLRRIPYYQRFTADEYDSRFQFCQLFFYVPSLNSHVLYDEFRCRRLDSLDDDIERKNHAIEIATRLATDIKKYDFGEYFGRRKMLPYQAFKKVYDFDSDSVKSIKLSNVFKSEIADYRAKNHIPLSQPLAYPQEYALYSDLKEQYANQYATLINQADFSKRPEMDKLKFYLDILAPYSRASEVVKSIPEQVNQEINYVKAAKSAIADGQKIDVMKEDRFARQLESQGVIKNVVPEYSDVLFNHVGLDFHCIGDLVTGKYLTEIACDLAIQKLTNFANSYAKNVVQKLANQVVKIDYNNPAYLPALPMKFRTISELAKGSPAPTATGLEPLLKQSN